jgi:hypothetical protein
MSYATARFTGMVTSYDQMLTVVLTNASGPYEFMGKLAASWEKGHRKDIRMLEDGSADLVLNFPGGLGPLVAVLTELDALQAMASLATAPDD